MTPAEAVKIHSDIIKTCSGVAGRKDLPEGLKREIQTWCSKFKDAPWLKTETHQSYMEDSIKLKQKIEDFKARARKHMTAGRKRRRRMTKKKSI